MAVIVAFTVPGVPVPKGRGRVGKLSNGRPVVYTPLETRAYEATITTEAWLAMAGKEVIDEAVKVHVAAWLPVPQSWPAKKREQALSGAIRPTSRPDCDNYLKLAMDAMNGIVYRDDALVVEATCEKRYHAKPSLHVYVTTLPGRPCIERT